MNTIKLIEELKTVARSAKRKDGYVVICEDGNIYANSGSYNSIKMGGGKIAIIDPGDILCDCIRIRHDWYWCGNYEEVTLQELAKMIEKDFEWNQY